MKKLLLSLLAMGGLLVVGCTSDEPEMSMVEEKVETVEQPVPTDPDFVTKEDLEDVVKKYTKSCVQSRGEAKSYSTSLVNGRTGKPAYYVVNFDNEKGYMLVSANKNYAPVLAYVEKGSFGPEAYVTPGIAEWLIETTEAIDNIDSVEDSIKSQTRALWSPYLRKRSLGEAEKAALLLSRGAQMGDRNNHPELIPIMQDSIRRWEAKGWTVWYFEDYPFTDPSREEMMENMRSAADWRYIDDAPALSLVVKKTTYADGGAASNLSGIQWNQIEPWNAKFPMLNDNKTRAVVGCVPVAVGQMMRFFKYPTYFAWNNMPPTYPTSTTQDFLYQLAEKIDVDYNKDDVGGDRHTSGNSGNAVNVLKSYGYKVFESSNISPSVPPCLASSTMKRPNKKDTGHMYILAGSSTSTTSETVECYTFMYKERMQSCYTLSSTSSSHTEYYVNWGWGGRYDGYYMHPENTPPSGSEFTANKINKYYMVRK